MNIDTIRQKNTRLKTAQEALFNATKSAWPIGSTVYFNIRHNQNTPSSGTVTGYRGGGYVRVKHHQAKEHSRNSHRDIHFENIV